MSATRCFCYPCNHLPSAEEEQLLTDRLYPDCLAVAVSKKKMLRLAVGRVEYVSAHRELGRKVVAVAEVAAVVDWGHDSFDMCRPVAGHNGYTWLSPAIRERMPLPRRLDAIPASFAARIAFSNLVIRSAAK